MSGVWVRWPGKDVWACGWDVEHAGARFPITVGDVKRVPGGKTVARVLVLASELAEVVSWAEGDEWWLDAEVLTDPARDEWRLLRHLAGMV